MNCHKKQKVRVHIRGSYKKELCRELDPFEKYGANACGPVSYDERRTLDYLLRKVERVLSVEPDNEKFRKAKARLLARRETPQAWFYRDVPNPELAELFLEAEGGKQNG